MTPAEQSVRIREICALAPVIPVLVIEDAAWAVPLAQALVAGGLPALEVTLRTPMRLRRSPPWPRCRARWWGRGRC